MNQEKNVTLFLTKWEEKYNSFIKIKFTSVFIDLKDNKKYGNRSGYNNPYNLKRKFNISEKEFNENIDKR